MKANCLNLAAIASAAIVLTQPVRCDASQIQWDPPEGWPTGTNRLDDATLARKLDEVADAKLSLVDSCLWVQSVVADGRREQVPQLKKIARALASNRERHLSAFEALCGLWSLGGDKAFFIENARMYDKDPQLAGYSIRVMAYEPDPAVTNELQAIWRTSTNNFVRGAVASYRGALFIREHYGSMVDTNIAEKIRYLARHLVGGAWGGSSEHEPFEAGRPEVVWAKREMSELSRRNPEEVARAVLALDMRRVFQLDKEDKRHEDLHRREWKEYLAYVRTLLSDEAKAKYDALRKDQSESNAGSPQKTP